MNKPTRGPKCPNHGEYLEGVPFPLPEKGTGMCPVSGAEFEFELHLDDEKIVKDKFGNLSKSVDWKVDGEENTQNGRAE
jgi:hypothetical protein